MKTLRKEARELKEVVAERALELRIVKKSMIADGETTNEIPRIREAGDYPAGQAVALSARRTLQKIGIPSSTIHPAGEALQGDGANVRKLMDDLKAWA